MDFWLTKDAPSMNGSQGTCLHLGGIDPFLLGHAFWLEIYCIAILGEKKKGVKTLV